MAVTQKFILNQEMYQQQAEQFWQAEVEALYKAEAGLTDEYPLPEIYAQYEHLFSKETVLYLIEQTKVEPQNKTARYLAEFAVMRYMQKVTASFDEQFFGQLAQSHIDWDGEQLSFFATAGMLSNEVDASRRRELYQLRSQLIDEQNQIRVQRWQVIHDESRALGFDSYHELCDSLRGLHLAELQNLAESFLQETAVTYFQQLAFWGEQILGTSEVAAADMFYLMRGQQFDKHFGEAGLETAIYQTARDLGIALNTFPALELDLEARPGKNPRPFCAYIQVPTNIKLVVNPIGGHTDYRAALHELGHALHGIHIDPTMNFAGRYLGDESVGEAFAFLMENLVPQSAWLTHHMGQHDYQEFSSFMQFLNLLTIRRCATKILYENSLHTDLTDAPFRYAMLMQEHLGLNTSPVYYLLDVDDGFYNAQYFRAWLLEAQMTYYLRDTFGDAWFTNVEAGQFLSTLWQKGQYDPAEELVYQFRGEGLRIDALRSRFSA